MLKIASILFFSSMLTSGEMVFYCKKKFVDAGTKVEREWRLHIKSKAEFSYMIINKIASEQKGSPKGDTVVYKGLWRYDGDTLFLYSDFCSNNPKNEMKYLRKGKYLYSIDNCLDSFGAKRIERLCMAKSK